MYDFPFSYLAKSQACIQTSEAAMKAIRARLNNWLIKLLYLCLCKLSCEDCTNGEVLPH